MQQKRSSSDANHEESELTPEPRVTAKQFDMAFDSLATFLFEQYRIHKENASSAPSQKAI